MTDRIPGPYLSIACSCGHDAMLYEQVGGPEWISGVTLEDTKRMRCSACGKIGEIAGMRKGWQLVDCWSSSNR